MFLGLAVVNRLRFFVFRHIFPPNALFISLIKARLFWHDLIFYSKCELQMHLVISKILKGRYNLTSTFMNNVPNYIRYVV